MDLFMSRLQTVSHVEKIEQTWEDKAQGDMGTTWNIMRGTTYEGARLWCITKNFSLIGLIKIGIIILSTIKVIVISSD